MKVGSLNVLITGSSGFVGRNLCLALTAHPEHRVFRFDLDHRESDLDEGLQKADVIFHLAGVNRPKHVEEFMTGNRDFTETICQKLYALGRTPRIVLASSIQTQLSNPYGASKLAAEEVLRSYSLQPDASVVVYRLKNLFGKWCRPNYNAVTATFCYNIANDLPIQISNRDNIVDLTYIDDVIKAFMRELRITTVPGLNFAKELHSTRITLGDLAKRIQAFHDSRTSLKLPNYSDRFTRALYATYLSYLEPANFDYQLEKKSDPRGSLAEFLKSPQLGQIFISRTKPGITRGNHYHNTKAEKFLVVQGEAIIRFRHVEKKDVIEFRVRGEDYHVVDIIPGYTHSIQNVGAGELVTLFWSSEVFDPDRTDTMPLPVFVTE
jgi:UDP-2-acetamido-2,6-beta-L-arabino-hexul-4-ose reductase